MIERVLSNMKVQSLVRLATALSFAFFSVYQIYMAIQTESNRRGRQVGVVLYLLFTIASFLAFSYMRELQRVRTFLMLFGLIVLFIVRMRTVEYMIKTRNSAEISSLLNCVVYILPQIGTLALATMFLLRRGGAAYQQIAPLILVAILIYAACFAVECVLMIRYRMNIDLGLKLTLLSRLLYFVGFAGTALSFAFCDPTIFLRAQLHSAGGKATTSNAATLPTADAEKDRYEMPAIPLN